MLFILFAVWEFLACTKIQMHTMWNIGSVKTIANDAVLGEHFRFGIVYDDRMNH